MNASSMQTGLDRRERMIERIRQAVPEPDQLIALLRAGNPRLYLQPEDFQRAQHAITDDGWARSTWTRLREHGLARLHAPLPTRELRDGHRLLYVSREIVDDIQTLCTIWKLTGDSAYSQRCIQIMLATTEFEDWNPSHFLDTAEMVHALAIGCDLLHEVLDQSTRDRIFDGIVAKGMEPGLSAYEGRVAGSDWPNWTHNWNQVCNGGLTMGALVIAEYAPRIAGRILREAIIRLPRAIGDHFPDGGWGEGPNYWRYAIEYTVPTIAALKHALGTDFGLSELPGLDKAGWFPIHMAGPTGRTFNFADADTVVIQSPQLFWLAHRFGQSAFATYQRRFAKPSALDLLWYMPEAEDEPSVSTTGYFRPHRLEVVTMRTAWDDPDAMFVGFKGGDNQVNHGNLDLGSFILESGGERFVEDLGRDDYNQTGYWSRARPDSPRWAIYRMRAEGHNTLVINPGTAADQCIDAQAAVVKLHAEPPKSFAVLDLTGAYPDSTRVQRGILLDHETHELIVRDEVQLKQPGELWWFLHTAADVALTSPRIATLTLNGKTLEARLEQPTRASFQIMAADPLPTSPNPEGQRDRDGFRKLAIRLTGIENCAIVVRLGHALGDTTRGKPKFEAPELDAWSARV
ncbi:MAG: heparinase II/III family protein [Phycisphaeraceae bacterium]|nr:heparinase II/III family protein [Phycisphaeraceae bacterium]